MSVQRHWARLIPDDVAKRAQVVFAIDHENELFEHKARIREIEAELAKEKGGWDAFYKLRKSIAEGRYPGLTGEIHSQRRGEAMSAFDSFELRDAKVRIRELEKALESIWNDPTTSAKALRAKAYDAWCSQSDRGVKP